MNALLPPVLARALAPMAPADSVVHRIVSADEKREVAEIRAHHFEEYRAGLDKVDPEWVTPEEPDYMDARKWAYWERYE